MPRDAAPSRRRAASLTMLSSYFTTAFGVITGIVLVPVYLRHFSMATYGAWLASGGLVTMLGLVDGGLSIVIGQRLSHSVGTTNTHALARVAGTGWAVISGACGLLLLLGLGVAPHVPAWIHAPAADHGALTEAFVLAAIGTACALAQTNLLSYAHAWQTTGVVATTNLITLTACVVAALGALANGAGVVALGFATAVRGALGLVIAVVFVGHDWRRRGLPPPHLDRAELHTQLRLTAPVFVGRFGGVALGNGESALVAAFINPEAAAVLALTGKVYGVCQSLINPIAGSAFLPLAHLAGSSSKGRVGVVVRELFALSGVLTAWVCAMALVGNAPFMTLWVGPEAYGGFWLSALLCVNTVAITRLNLLGMVLPGLGVLGAPSLAALAELGIRLGLLGLLLPALGMVGVPLATLLSMLCTHAWFLPWLLARWLQQPLTAVLRMTAAATPSLLLCLGV
ncbi:MAG TPA: oligosaccharide flippase family protein, partial [Myxococcota bacterium]|nr:oligosaccharide flippase family protein [Myxococcota bacterium]